MADELHTLMDGKVNLYKREGSSLWQCSTYMDSRNHRTSTKQDNLFLAQEFARQWYMELYVASKKARGAALNIPQVQKYEDTTKQALTAKPSKVKKKAEGPTFKDAADAFLKDYKVMTQGERNEKYVEGKDLHVRVHLLPFFGEIPITEITAGLIQDYRVHRQTSRKDKEGKAIKPARATMHSEMVTLRQILKAANRKGWISALPDMSTPYKSSGKVEHRAWFSPDEYKILYEATRARAKNPLNERWRSVCEDFHDYVLFMGNTGLRPDESARLEFRDVTIVDDHATGERILEIEVRGKRGVGYCKSMNGAVVPFERISKRKNLKPTDRIFGKTPRELMNNVLDELNMKFDRHGHVRTCYSLRHTYICMRLMEGADIYQVAKNCRTSVEMIEKFYGRHLKDNIDASAVNVRKKKPRKPSKKSEEAED